MTICSSEQYLKLGKFYIELYPIEKHIDNLLSLLRAEELTPSFPIQEIQTVSSKFQHFCDTYVDSSIIPSSKKFQVNIKNIMYLHNCLLLQERKFNTIFDKRLEKPRPGI